MDTVFTSPVCFPTTSANCQSAAVKCLFEIYSTWMAPKAARKVASLYSNDKSRSLGRAVLAWAVLVLCVIGLRYVTAIISPYTVRGLIRSALSRKPIHCSPSRDLKIAPYEGS